MLGAGSPSTVFQYALDAAGSANPNTTRPAKTTAPAGTTRATDVSPSSPQSLRSSAGPPPASTPPATPPPPRVPIPPLRPPHGAQGAPPDDSPLARVARPYAGLARPRTLVRVGRPLRHPTGNGFHGAYQFTLSSWAAVGGRDSRITRRPLSRTSARSIAMAPRRRSLAGVRMMALPDQNEFEVRRRRPRSSAGVYRGAGSDLSWVPCGSLSGRRRSNSRCPWSDARRLGRRQLIGPVILEREERRKVVAANPDASARRLGVALGVRPRNDPQRSQGIGR